MCTNKRNSVITFLIWILSQSCEKSIKSAKHFTKEFESGQSHYGEPNQNCMGITQYYIVYGYFTMFLRWTMPGGDVTVNWNSIERKLMYFILCILFITAMMIWIQIQCEYLTGVKTSMLMLILHGPSPNKVKACDDIPSVFSDTYPENNDHQFCWFMPGFELPSFRMRAGNVNGWTTWAINLENTLKRRTLKIVEIFKFGSLTCVQKPEIKLKMALT